MADTTTPTTLHDARHAGDPAVEGLPAPQRQTSWAGPASLGLLVAGASWLSITMTRFEAGVATLWIANGLLVTAMLLAPRAHWWRLMLAAALGAVTVRWALGDPLVQVYGLSAANLIEAWIVGFGIRRDIPDLRDPAQLKPLAANALGWTLLACVVSATLATMLIVSGNGVPAHVVWITWFTAHLLGMVIVATLGVTSRQLGWRVFGRQGRRLDFAACLALLLATCVAVALQHRLPLLFLTYLPLVLFTFRHGIAGVVLGTMILALAGGAYAALGVGPFALGGGASAGERTLLLQIYVGAGCLLAYPISIALAERRRLAAQVRQSESRYRLLAEHSRDLIVRLAPDGHRPYVSPSSTALLGWSPAELAEARPELLHPDDRVRARAEMERLWTQGGSAIITYRFRHKAGYDVWLEAHVKRVDEVDPPEIVYSARDVTARVFAEEAMQESQAQLQAVSDNMPALIAHFDTQERFTFANAAVVRLLRLPLTSIIGRPLRELYGEAAYAQVFGHIGAALAGEARSFEAEAEVHGRHYHHRTSFVPDRAADGSSKGFFSLTLDITAQKHAERELERLARFDPLTGLANRRHFDESLHVAVARAQRAGVPLVLLALDIDRFKQINDSLGHATGDAVLKAVASRIRDCIYEVDLPARLGGDEFVVLIEYSPSVEVGEMVASRIVESMRAPLVLGGASLDVTASVGVGVHFPVRSGEVLSALADEALYDAKRAGRNTYRVRTG